MFSFTSPTAPSAGSLVSPILRWGAASSLFPAPSFPFSSSQWLGASLKGEQKQRLMHHGTRKTEVRRGTHMCRSSTFPLVLWGQRQPWCPGAADLLPFRRGSLRQA